MTLILAGHADAGPLENATAAFKQGDYSTALALWRPLAEEGNAAAETGLGILYENGLVLPKDEAQAVALYRKAAEQGDDAEAEYRLGEGYVTGSGLPHDIAQGLALMIKAGEQGKAGSFTSIGNYYRVGMYGIPKDYAKAFTWFQKAANLGDTSAEERVGIAYQFGQGVAVDLAEAALWYRKVEEQTRKDAERGDALAESWLGRMYEWGHGNGSISVDKNTALSWFRKAAEHEHEGLLKSLAESDVARVESALKRASGK